MFASKKAVKDLELVMHRQSSCSVLMVRPSQFEANQQTLADNVFQHPTLKQTARSVREKALEEFDLLRSKLEASGINVVVFQDPSDDPAPDSIFPNNWFSTHPGGELVLYPMMAPNRRRERRQKIIDYLKSNTSRLIDLTIYEHENQFLESTGSLAIDHQSKLAFACLSKRTSPKVLDKWSEKLGCRVLMFAAHSEDGSPLYHTNVMMNIGTNYSIYCSEAISDMTQRAVVSKSIGSLGRTVIDISREQLKQFCGNILELKSGTGRFFVVMSENARAAFSEQQLALLSKKAEIISTPLDTVEQHGGGSARCMLAEIFFPTAN